MFYKNPNSTRENPFREVYDHPQFASVLQNKENMPLFPFLVDIELTNYCNLQCIFCGQQAMERLKGFMSRETFQKVIDECAMYNTPVRFIRWGEPFLHKDIIDFCSYVKSKNLLLHITNNGLAIKEKHMKALIDLGLDSLVFSFQGATRQEYEIMRNNQLYHKLKANILKFLELRGCKEKPYIHLSTTITNEIQEEVEHFINYWGQLVDSVGVGKTNLSNLSFHQFMSFEAAGKLAFLKKKETINKIYRPCTEVYQKLSVDWDGKITCCCSDFDNYLTVGNINNQTLTDIWQHSQKLKLFREMLDQNMHKCLTLCSTCYHTYEEF